MILPVFAVTTPTKLDSVPPAYAFAAVVRGKLNGTLQLKAEKIVRQFKFSSGHCCSAVSNLKSELPGSFLQKEGRLNAAQLEAHLAETRHAKTNPWDMAKKLSDLQGDELLAKKTSHALLLLAAMAVIPAAEVTFQPDAVPSSEPALIPGLRLLITVASKTSPDLIAHLFEGLAPDSRITMDKKLEKTLEPLPLDSDEKGLLTVIRNSKTIADIYEGSFLKKERITFLLFAYALIGLFSLEMAADVAKREFIGALDEAGCALRQEILDLSGKMNETTYYEWLGVERAATAQEIRRKGTARLERYAAPSVEKLFLEGEKNVIPPLLEQLKEALAVLTNPVQRTEYDNFVAGGGKGSFVQQSATVRDETVLKEVQHLLVGGSPAQAISLLEKAVGEASSNVLVTTYVRMVLKFEKPIGQERRTRVLAELKQALHRTPCDGRLFELVGEWSIATNQKAQAMDAFQRALLLNPTSKSVQGQLRRIDPKTAGKVIVTALFYGLKGLNHYQLLGVPSVANPTAIRAAYRALTKEFHPDRFFTSHEPEVGNQSKEVYKRIVGAYMTLKNAPKRAEYDRSLLQQTPILETEGGPQTLQGKRFYDLALAAIRQGKLDMAKLNLQMGLQSEPQNAFLRQKLDEISRQPT